jgi:hypothetical protein
MAIKKFDLVDERTQHFLRALMRPSAQKKPLRQSIQRKKATPRNPPSSATRAGVARSND